MTRDADSPNNTAVDRSADRPYRRRRRVWWLVATTLVVGVIGAGAVVYVRLADPERVRHAAEHYLQRYFAGPVSIRAAAFSWTEGVRLFDVSVGAAMPKAEAAAGGTVDQPGARAALGAVRPILTCREIRLRYDPITALTGDLRLRSITAIEPILDVARRRGSDQSDLSGFLRPDRPVAQTARPTIELRDGLIRVHVRSEHGEDRSSEMAVSVRALPSDDPRFAYDVVWQSPGANGHSRIDAREGLPIHVAGGLPPMPLDIAALVSGLSVPGTGALVDSLAASGVARVTTYSLAPSTGGGPSATIALSNVAMSIPLDDAERKVAPELRYARVEDVVGQVQWSDGTLHADLSGRLRGSDFTLALILVPGNAAPLASLDDCRVEGRLTAAALALPIPDETAAPGDVRLIRRIPALATLYDEFDPRGRVDLDVSFSKPAGVGSTLKVTRAALRLSDGAALVRSVDASLSNVAGRIDYSPGSIVLRELRGRHGDTTVQVDGRLAGVAASAEKRLTIRATNVPLGDELWSHLPKRFAAERRRFQPEGSVDATIELHRPAAPGDDPRPWSASAKVDLHDVSILPDRFPYPFDQFSGMVELDAAGVKLHDVHGRGGAGEVRIDGEVAFNGSDVESLNVSIAGRGLVFDDSLRQALPPKPRAFVARFGPSGPFDIDSTVSLDGSSGKLKHETIVTLRGMSMLYDAFPVTLTDLLGQVKVTSDTILVDGVTGRYRSATFSIDGNISPNHTPGGTALRVHGRDIVLDAALRAALPPGIRGGLAKWTIEGPIVADTILTGRQPGQSWFGIRTTAKLVGGRVSHPFFPTPFEDVTIDVDADHDGFRAKGATARYGGADVRADIDIVSTKQGSKGVIKIDAAGLPLNDSVRGLGYARVADAWDRLKPSGSVDVHFAALRFSPGAVGGAKEWTLSGYVDFREVALPGFGDAKRATGSLIAEGTLIDAAGNSSLSGRVAFAKAELVGQRVTRTDGRWSFAGRPDGEGVISLRELQGRIYNGAWMSDVDVHFGGGRVAYDLTTTLQRMQIEPLLSAETAAHLPAAGPVKVEGLASGQLRLSGVVGDPATRRGRGRFEITDGRMYRLPLILAILNVLKLSRPTDDAFDQARADFIIDGNRIELDDIRLRGTSLALVGKGTMNWPDRGVDLSFINVSPRQWPRLPLLADFVESAGGEIVQLHVTGPIYQPKVQTRTFRGLTDELKRLFQKKEPKTIHPLP